MNRPIYGVNDVTSKLNPIEDRLSKFSIIMLEIIFNKFINKSSIRFQI